MFDSLYRDEPPWWREFWPVIEELESARSENRVGVSASIALATAGAILALASWSLGGRGSMASSGHSIHALLGPLAFLAGSVLFLFAAWGISRMSRAAAVASILLLLVDCLLIALIPPLGGGGGVLVGFLAPRLVRGACGTYAYHRLSKKGA